MIYSVNLFECVTLHFEELGAWHVTGGIGELRSLVDDLAGGRHTLPEMIGLINGLPGSSRARSRRVTVGHITWLD